MQIVFDIGIILLAYLFGAIPFGLLIVKLKTGKDIREVESGRTGGTNAMRAAGFWAGFATAMLDILKGLGAVWVAQQVTSDQWVHVVAPLAAIIGHNYSIFLPERDENGKLTGLGGGAGGAASVGGAHGALARLDLYHPAARRVDFLHGGHRIHYHHGCGFILPSSSSLSALQWDNALDVCLVWRGRGNFTRLGIASEHQEII